jgi:hypothetical protein
VTGVSGFSSFRQTAGKEGRSSDAGPAWSWETPSPVVDGDVVERLERLERLDALHRSGALDNAEYESAKNQVLGKERRDSERSHVLAMLQLAAVAVGIYAGVRLFHWVTG